MTGSDVGIIFLVNPFPSNKDRFIAIAASLTITCNYQAVEKVMIDFL